MTHDLGRLDVPATQTLAGITDDESVPFTVTLAAYAALNHHDRFTQLHRDYRDRVEAFIASRLPRADRHLAEDIASDAFADLWFRMVSRGVQVGDGAFGLLVTIAKRCMWHHLNRKHDTAVDFTDPENVTARTTAAPASTLPHLAALYADLERAKDALTAAAHTYRQAQIAAGSATGALKLATRPEVVKRATARAERLTETAAAALADFRAAAARVAELRNAWNTAADNTPVLGVTR